MNSPEMARIRGEIDRWLNTSDDDAVRLNKLAEDADLASKVMVFINIITELGIAYEAGLVNKNLTHEIWYPMIPRYWERLQFYVYDTRRSGYPVGHYLEMMAQKIDDYAKKKDLSSRYKAPCPIRSDSSEEVS